jgi:hypothetical protein
LTWWMPRSRETSAKHVIDGECARVAEALALMGDGHLRRVADNWGDTRYAGGASAT